MLHQRHWKPESRSGDYCESPCQTPQHATGDRWSPRILSTSFEDQCLTPDLYLFKEAVHHEFLDSWKPDPSETKAA